MLSYIDTTTSRYCIDTQPQKSNNLEISRIRYPYERNVVLLFKLYIFSKPIVI